MKCKNDSTKMLQHTHLSYIMYISHHIPAPWTIHVCEYSQTSLKLCDWLTDSSSGICILAAHCDTSDIKLNVGMLRFLIHFKTIFHHFPHVYFPLSSLFLFLFREESPSDSSAKTSMRKLRSWRRASLSQSKSMWRCVYAACYWSLTHHWPFTFNTVPSHDCG